MRVGAAVNQADHRCGDYNFDFDFRNLTGRNGRDRCRDSMLDFMFVDQGARDWKAAVVVIVQTGDFRDDERTSDHRPVEATFDPATPGVDVVCRGSDGVRRSSRDELVAAAYRLFTYV